jgi:Flp pilus assembly protein TadD
MESTGKSASGSTQTRRAAGSELMAAYGLLRNGRLRDAETACRAVLTRSPRDGGALHLLGLIRKEAGDLTGAERLLRQSITLEPGRADFRANLGNLLRRAGRLADAEHCYREALARDRAHTEARLGLARTLNDLGQHSAAESECRVLVATHGRNPQSWTALAMVLRDQHRLAEAEAAYRNAITLSPQHGLAHHGLGTLLSRMDRPQEALEALECAQSAGIRGPQLAFNRGCALLQIYRLDEAELAFAEAVAQAPTDREAQLSLARLRFMRGDPGFARDIASAVAATPDDAALQLMFADVLRRTGDLQTSEALIRDLLSRDGPAPETRAALATVLQEAGRLEEAEVEAREAAALRPQDVAIAENLVAILLARGRADAAVDLIRDQRERQPDEQRWIAYEVTAARLTGNALYRELYDYERCVRSYDLEPPPGWSSMQELNAALVRTLAARHRFAAHPFDQSLRHGSQTAHNLLADPDPAIQAVLKAFQAPIESYRRSMGTDPGHPLSMRNHGSAAISGAWSVQLQRGGYHVNHLHPEGWISSAYYVAVPDEVRDANVMSGWIKFGEPRLPVPGANAGHFVQPRAGLLVLFPSYMWHGTNAIHGSEPRLTIAFDAVPARR